MEDERTWLVYISGTLNVLVCLRSVKRQDGNERAVKMTLCPLLECCCKDVWFVCEYYFSLDVDV